MKAADNKTKITIASWKRKAHFEFFKTFTNPFWGITVPVDCTHAYHYCKANNIPFSSFYLYASLKAVNQIPEFKYRIEGQDVFEYEKIAGSVTVLRENETFGFANFPFDPDFAVFRKKLEAILAAEKLNTALLPEENPIQVVHYSVLPLAHFTSYEHAQNQNKTDSIPKIVFGKFQESGKQLILPLSVHVHHALCDGIHVGKFVKLMEKYLGSDLPV